MKVMSMVLVLQRNSIKLVSKNINNFTIEIKRIVSQNFRCEVEEKGVEAVVILTADE